MKHIINLDALPRFEKLSHGEKFEAKDGEISRLIGAKQLGYSLIVVPPGKVGLAVDSTPGQSPRNLTIEWRGRLGSKLDYWDGE